MSANRDFVASHKRWFSKVMISPVEINDRLISGEPLLVF